MKQNSSMIHANNNIMPIVVRPQLSACVAYFAFALFCSRSAVAFLVPPERSVSSPCSTSRGFSIISTNVAPQRHRPRSLALFASVVNATDETSADATIISPSNIMGDEAAGNIKTNRDGNDQNNSASAGTIPNVVLVAGFESFNRGLYQQAAARLPEGIQINLQVFADCDIRRPGASAGSDDTEATVNPRFAAAMEKADAFIGSLIFDYDDALAVESLLDHVKGPRLIFESATELMAYNRVGTFSMEQKGEGPSGPPPAVKAILNKFSSGKEEDKINGYLKMLKIGPDLLKYVPGEKAGDLRTWLEAYRYWNQGGVANASSMLQLLAQRVLPHNKNIERIPLPDLEVTPDVGVLHPLTMDGKASTGSRYFASPREYIDWRESNECQKLAEQRGFRLAPKATAPRVAVLLYRKHVITGQRYIGDLITQMEADGIIPIPVFINGVEAHTIVRDLLTSDYEISGVVAGTIVRDTTYQPSHAAKVDVIVSTIGFPLVGGPAGSMEAGRNVAVAETLLSSMNIPYIVASPLLLQSIPQWKQSGVLGLQSVVLYSLPELDGAVDTVVLGGLVGDKIAIVPERARKLDRRIHGWINLRRTKPAERKLSIMLYGFPPNVGAVGTAALLDVPNSLQNLLLRLHEEGYDVGDFATDPDACGESIVAALRVLNEAPVIAGGACRMQVALEDHMERARNGDKTVAETLAKPLGGLGDATVRAIDVSNDEVDKVLGKYMAKKVRRAWSEKERGPGVSASGDLVVAGIQVGNIWITVQPLLGVEGDPMRLLFERNLTPHPQYCAAYEYMRLPEHDGGIGSQTVIHLGMHGTEEWLPGQPLGNDRQSWSDELIGDIPNLYIYAANNPSESILAKRRGYGTLISYNVPPYGRAGLYLELANLRDLVSEYRSAEATDEASGKSSRNDLRGAIWSSCQRCEIICDNPLLVRPGDKTSAFTEADIDSSISVEAFDTWIVDLADYLIELQDRLFSSGLHTLGSAPSDEDLKAYLNAYFGEKLPPDAVDQAIANWHNQQKQQQEPDLVGADWFHIFSAWLKGFASEFGTPTKEDMESLSSESDKEGSHEDVMTEAGTIIDLLSRNTEELDAVITGLDGGYIPPKPGGDLLRDGVGVLPTGKNIHALDPYRMPSAGAWVRGQLAAEEIIRQHREVNGGKYPSTTAVTLWGLDTIKTRGESIAIVLALVGAQPVKEGTGRVVRFDLLPLEELGRPRIDVLASLSGIFRDSFANVVDLLDDMFERAATADEPEDMNFIKKHASELSADGVARPAARLFSNPPGDYGSMVNEVVGTGDWEDERSLGETWKGRNSYSYGRNEGSGAGGQKGTARPQVLDKLLATTERVVQEIDSVEYGLTDIQEYYANTGALKKAAENRKAVDSGTGEKKKVALSVIEAFGGGSGDTAKVPVRNVEDVLRLEYRSKLLNPKWRDAMIAQGSGGAYEVSQRMTAMVGWAATAQVDNFVFNEAAERYALDEEVAQKLQKSNPEAFKNVVRRLLEAAGRGMWETDEDTLDKLRSLYADADDLVERVASSFQKE